MDDLDARVWLNAWIEENLAAPGPAGDAPAMMREAELCRSAAEAEGISRAALDDAADGDLPLFLARQSALAREQARRRTE